MWGWPAVGNCGEATRKYNDGWTVPLGYRRGRFGFVPHQTGPLQGPRDDGGPSLSRMQTCNCDPASWGLSHHCEIPLEGQIMLVGWICQEITTKEAGAMDQAGGTDPAGGTDTAGVVDLARGHRSSRGSQIWKEQWIRHHLPDSTVCY